MRATRFACYVALVHPTQPEQSDFARLLAGIQKDAHLSYQQVADVAGVNRSQVWRWVNTGSAPGYEPVRRLAAHLVAAYPQLADAAAALLPAAGYQTPPVGAEPVTATGSISLPSPAVAGDVTEDADDVTRAVIIAAIGPTAVRQVWAEVHSHPEGTPAHAIFRDPIEVALFERDAPELQRIRWIAALRSVDTRPTRMRRAG